MKYNNNFEIMNCTTQKKIPLKNFYDISSCEILIALKQLLLFLVVLSTLNIEWTSTLCKPNMKLRSKKDSQTFPTLKLKLFEISATAED